MPNSLVEMVDSDMGLSAERVLESLSQVPFVSHQYRWLVSELRRLPESSSARMLAGYCGVRKENPRRLARLEEACRALKSLTDPEIAALPERTAPRPRATRRASGPLRRSGILSGKSPRGKNHEIKKTVVQSGR